MWNTLKKLSCLGSIVSLVSCVTGSSEQFPVAVDVVGDNKPDGPVRPVNFAPVSDRRSIYRILVREDLALLQVIANCRATADRGLQNCNIQNYFPRTPNAQRAAVDALGIVKIRRNQGIAIGGNVSLEMQFYRTDRALPHDFCIVVGICGTGPAGSYHPPSRW